jgi:hypothetical protein
VLEALLARERVRMRVRGGVVARRRVVKVGRWRARVVPARRRHKDVWLEQIDGKRRDWVGVSVAIFF